MTLLRPVRFERICGTLTVLLLAVLLIVLLENRSIADQMPRLLILDADSLSDIKEHLRTNDPTLDPPLTRLKHDAEQALHIGPMSVTDKTLLPPSGNKHDYMSIAPYWWPNPSTPNGLPFVRRDGEVNPERDHTSDHPRLEATIQDVKTLAIAYYFFGREDYAAHAARLLRVWFLDPTTKMNPHLKYAQAVPGRNTGRGAGIIETHDLPELIDFVSLLRSSKAWPANQNQQWQAWNNAYVSWLLESPEGKTEAKAQNNHGIWFDVQVAALASFVGRDGVAKNVLREFPAKRIDVQILPDGRQPRELARTRAWDYSVFNIEALFNAASIAEKSGADLWNYKSGDGRGIRQALDWLLPFAIGESKWAHSQISPFQPEKLAPLLRRAAISYRDPAYERAIGRLPVVNGSERWELLNPKMRELK